MALFSNLLNPRACTCLISNLLLSYTSSPRNHIYVYVYTYTEREREREREREGVKFLSDKTFRKK
jgi:hypothetical protein